MAVRSFLSPPPGPAGGENAAPRPRAPAPLASGPFRGTRATRWLAPLVPGVVVILLWLLLIYVVRLPPLLLPSPPAVATSLWYGATSGVLFWGVLTTLGESLAGFALGAVVALPLGYAVARSRWLAAALQPYLAASQAIPAVALAPLLEVWIGYGLVPTAILGALIIFFPTTISTTLGLMSLDRDVLDAARVDGADRWALFWHIEAPMALPAILAGLRTSLTLSITGAVVGEFVLGGDGYGLGSQLTVALGSVGGTATIFAILLVLATLAALLYGAVRLVERRISYLEEA